MVDAEKRVFVPGFLTAKQARTAGQLFFRRTNGALGREGRHFHLIQNGHGRWHFEAGRRPRDAVQATGGRSDG